MKQLFLIIIFAFFASVTFSQEARSYLDNGSQLKTRDYKSDIKSFNRSIRNDPKNAKLYYYRGLTKDNANDSIGAIKDYTKAIEIDSMLGYAYINRGNLKCRASDYSGAILDFTKAIELAPLDPDYSMAYRNRGLVNYFLGNEDTACIDWHIAVELGNKETEELIKKYCH